MGRKYEHTFIGAHNHNVPSAVCYTSNRDAELMIPARINCPRSWTEEYQGYLMSSHHGHYRIDYACVDERAEFIPGTASNRDGALFYNVVAEPKRGLPGYVATDTITCVVCTK